VPFDAGQEGEGVGVDDGATTVDEVLVLEMIDEELEELELVADDEELELEREEIVAELEGMVEVVNEVGEGIAPELSVLKLLVANIEEALALAVVLVDTEVDVAVVLALVDTELDVVVIGRRYPATLVLRRFAVLTKD
jgi:hypothetical protein